MERSLQVHRETPWTLSASAFNWTPDVIRAEHPATDIAAGIVSSGVASVIELELGQLWRSFPDPSKAEAVALRERLTDVGGRVSIVGVSIDDWLSPTRRRDEEQRFAFLRPQLEAARELGAEGIRLPIGQAGPMLLRRIQPLLHELRLTLYEELQGQQAPDAPQVPRAIEDIAALDDPSIRLLVDTSMLMPALPPSYLEQLAAGGLPPDLLARLTNDWLEPATLDAVVALLRAGGVPPQAHTLYMNLLVRFGRSSVDVLRDILPLIGAFHLKFWDLDDTDDRVSQPLRDVGSLLRGSEFTGTLCSEWGGHEWLDDDAAGMTRRHLALARASLASGFNPSRHPSAQAPA
ncbi:restriction endonuclease subunit R [Diaminobutyricibacter tongyongensis]|uniref:Restriction endonuclease subunit R n=1 Tax=Leifsonia tongyongensis TaxID=1268043 RepID=A0A6L9XWX0_9MICO|nr:restriction endonuclease subunit R [Diaminobutyricibacter tongyongensis]